jgi:hypothetical protein
VSQTAVQPVPGPHPVATANAIRSVDTRVVRATVHRNGALVVRAGRAHGRIEVHGLPLLLAGDSLRVRPVRGVVRFLDEICRIEGERTARPAVHEQLRHVEAGLVRTEEELVTLDLVKRRLESCVVDPQHLRRDSIKLPDATAWLAFTHTVQERLRALGDDVERVTRARRALERERQTLNAYAQQDPEPPRFTRGVAFTIDDVTDDVDFELEYFVAAATWRPTYTLQLEGTKANLSSAAWVAQASGEDWSGVELLLSTADLVRETTLPVLRSWRIGRAQPPALRAFRPLPSDLPSLFAGYDQGPRPPRPTPPTPLPPPALRPPPPAFPSVAAALDDAFDEDTDGGNADRGSRAAPVVYGALAPPPPPMAFAMPSGMPMPSRPPAPGAAPQSQSMPSMEMQRAAMPSAKRARGRMREESESSAEMSLGMASFGSGGGGDGDGDDVTRTTTELPPRLRNAYLRLRGADEHQRGTLTPLSMFEHLAWLVEAHDTSPEVRAALQRAVDALTRAAALMQGRTRAEPSFSAATSLSFEPPQRARGVVEVASDGSDVRVALGTFELPFSLEHHAVPRMSNDVWRVCQVKAPGVSLPPGPLTVYEDGRFVVNGALDAAGLRLTLNLGIDIDVRVLSRIATMGQSEKGLMTQTTVVEHTVKTELRSTKSVPVRMVVFDRVPVAGSDIDKLVVVKLGSSTPPLKRTDRSPQDTPLEGGTRVELTLMPGDTTTIEHRYTIELPGKSELEGGNRRE